MRTTRCATMSACVTRVCLHFFAVTTISSLLTNKESVFTERNLSRGKVCQSNLSQGQSLTRWINRENLYFFLRASRVSFQAAGCKFNDDEFFMKSAVCFAIPAKCKTYHLPCKADYVK